MRYLTARRHFAAHRQPLSVLAIGPTDLTRPLTGLSIGKLEPDEVVHLWGDDERAAHALTTRHPARHRRLVVWHAFFETKPTPALIEAVSSLRDVRGTWLFASSPVAVDDTWAETFKLNVNARLSEAETVAWVQTALGGADMLTARTLLDRCGWEIESARNAIDSLRYVTDCPTIGDVNEIVVGDAGRDFVRHLTACRKREALAAIARLDRPQRALGSLEYRLLTAWVMLEHRPPVALMRVSDVANGLSVPRPLVDELLPLLRLYSRSKVRDRLEAVAVADTELRRLTPARSVLTVLVNLW